MFGSFYFSGILIAPSGSRSNELHTHRAPPWKVLASSWSWRCSPSFYNVRWQKCTSTFRFFSSIIARATWYLYSFLSRIFPLFVFFLHVNFFFLLTTSELERIIDDHFLFKVLFFLLFQAKPLLFGMLVILFIYLFNPLRSTGSRTDRRRNKGKGKKKETCR